MSHTKPPASEWEEMPPGFTIEEYKSKNSPWQLLTHAYRPFESMALAGALLSTVEVNGIPIEKVRVLTGPNDEWRAIGIPRQPKAPGHARQNERVKNSIRYVVKREAAV
jgi:hypothetical protein